MRKWLTLLIIGAHLLTPVSALAAPSVQVIISAVPTSGILTFTAVYVSDTQVDLDWTHDVSITNVMVRGKYGAEPSSATDGYLVYYGADLAASDTSMNFDENAGILYYKAYGETAPGVFGASLGADVEGIVMALIAFITLALVLTIGSFAMRKTVLALAAGISWMLLSTYSYTVSTMTWDVYYALFFMSAFMVIVCVFESVYMRPRKEKGEDVEISDIDRAHKEFKEQWGRTKIASYGTKAAKKVKW